MLISPKRAVLLLSVLIIFSITLIFFIQYFFGFEAIFSDQFEGAVLILFYLMLFIFPLTGGLVAYYFYRQRVKRTAKIEKIENYVQGAIKEGILHRELKLWEMEILEKKYHETKNRNFDLDRRASVFRIQGKLVRLGPVGNELVSIPEQWSIRGFELNEINYPDIRNKFFREGEEIALEFSPFSKWVWDTYKIIKNRKVWQMSLFEETFKLLEEGKIKIIARLACGTHDFDEIKTGDIISFSNFNISTLGFGPNINVKVDYLKHYPNLAALIQNEELSEAFPQAKNIEEAEHLFKSIYNYQERIKRGGIYAIRFRKADSKN